MNTNDWRTFKEAAKGTSPALDAAIDRAYDDVYEAAVEETITREIGDRLLADIVRIHAAALAGFGGSEASAIPKDAT